MHGMYNEIVIHLFFLIFFLIFFFFFESYRNKSGFKLFLELESVQSIIFDLPQTQDSWRLKTEVSKWDIDGL